MNILTS